MNLTTEQMEQILDGAPNGAEYFNIHPLFQNYLDAKGNPYSESNKVFVGNGKHGIYSNYIKLSDIRAELSSRLSLTIDKSVCLSNIAENDTQIGDEKTRLINRIEKHALTAKGCPDQARVVLLSSINRIIKEEQSVIERVRSALDQIEGYKILTNPSAEDEIHNHALDIAMREIKSQFKEVAGDE